MNIRINNSIYLSITSLAVILTVLGFSTPGIHSIDDQVKDKYNGDYSLYISNSAKPEIKWITDVEDVGVYELYNSKNELLVQGKTSSARAHTVQLDQKVVRPYILKYGGENTGMHEIQIRPEVKKPVGEYKRAEKIYVMGDVHGRYDELVNLLQKSKIVDDELNWLGDDAHLVFLGDLFDRGNDVIKVLWFIYQLEDKANEEGGKVHLVLGNHEIMTMTKDLRYVSEKELSIAQFHQMGYERLFHPTESLLGAWLRSKPSLMKIESVIFAHGGILELGGIKLDEFNNKAFRYMEDPIYLELMKDHPDSLKYDSNQWLAMRSFFYHPDSPYWYRGYVESDTLMPALKKMLKTYRSKMHVVAHTPLETITQRYEGLLVTTDLNEAATEILLLNKNRKKYDGYKINSQGIKTPLQESPEN